MNQKKTSNPNRINNEITSFEIRLIGDNVPESGKVYSRNAALKLADEMNLDLIEISSRENQSICRIEDYQKFLYQQKKKKKELAKNASKSVLKELRFGPNIDEGDFNTKVNQARKFLTNGDKVKVSVFFKGRSIQYTDIGKQNLLKFAIALEDCARADGMPELIGKRMSMSLSPVKRK